MDRCAQLVKRLTRTPFKAFAGLVLVPLILVGAIGCPGRPDFLVAFLASTGQLQFGADQTTLTFTISKVATARVAPNFTVGGSQPWISVSPLSGNSNGPEDPAVITVTVNRSLMNVGSNFGQVTVSAPGVQPVTVAISAISNIRADFSLSPSLPIVGQPVQFINQSAVAQGQAPITIFVWNFGDGTPVSTLQNPIHIFNAIGTYAVTLTVSNGVISDTRTIQVGVSGTVGPTAEFTAAPQTPIINQNVQFTDLSSPGTGTISSWVWDFGDGGSSNLQNPTHMYAIAGAYNIYLVVTTQFGTDDEVKFGFINVQPAPPTADFTADDTTPNSGQSVQFTDLSIPGSAPITAWLWNFGDGATSTMSDPAHIYTISGMYASAMSYTVSLTVTTSVGMDAEIKPNFITVSP